MQQKRMSYVVYSATIRTVIHNMVLWIIIALGAVILIFAIVRGIRAYNISQRKQFEEFAGRLGLRITDRGWTQQPLLSGTYREKEIQIEDIYHSTGKSGYFTHRITMQSDSPAALGPAISMSYQRGLPKLFAKIGRAFTSNSILFDNEEFDSKVITKAPDEMAARSIIDMEVQQAVLNLGKGSTNIKDGTVYFEAMGTARQNESMIQDILLLLYRLDEKLLRIKPAHKSKDPEYSGSYEGTGNEVSTSAANDSSAEMTFMDEDKYYTGD